MGHGSRHRLLARHRRHLAAAAPALISRRARCRLLLVAHRAQDEGVLRPAAHRHRGRVGRVPRARPLPLPAALRDGRRAGLRHGADLGLLRAHPESRGRDEDDHVPARQLGVHARRRHPAVRLRLPRGGAHLRRDGALHGGALRQHPVQRASHRVPAALGGLRLASFHVPVPHLVAGRLFCRPDGRLDDQRGRPQEGRRLRAHPHRLLHPAIRREVLGARHRRPRDDQRRLRLLCRVSRSRRRTSST